MGVLDALFNRGGNGVRPLTEVQAKRLVVAAKNKMDRLAFLLALNSGLALTELLAIRTADIDFSGNQVTIYAKQIRNLKLPPKVMQELREYLGNTNEDRLLFPLKADAMLKRFKAYQEVVAFDWRQLRHTYAELAVAKKENPAVIANNIGIPLAQLLQLYQFYKPNGDAAKEVV